jgi:hypothetical protein
LVPTNRAPVRASYRSREPVKHGLGLVIRRRLCSSEDAPGQRRPGAGLARSRAFAVPLRRRGILTSKAGERPSMHSDASKRVTVFRSRCPGEAGFEKSAPSMPSASMDRQDSPCVAPCRCGRSTFWQRGQNSRSAHRAHIQFIERRGDQQAPAHSVSMGTIPGKPDRPPGALTCSIGKGRLTPELSGRPHNAGLGAVLAADRDDFSSAWTSIPEHV